MANIQVIPVPVIRLLLASTEPICCIPGPCCIWTVKYCHHTGGHPSWRNVHWGFRLFVCGKEVGMVMQAGTGFLQAFMGDNYIIRPLMGKMSRKTRGVFCCTSRQWLYPANISGSCSLFSIFTVLLFDRQSRPVTSWGVCEWVVVTITNRSRVDSFCASL